MRFPRAERSHDRASLTQYQVLLPRYWTSSNTPPVYRQGCYWRRGRSMNNDRRRYSDLHPAVGAREEGRDIGAYSPRCVPTRVPSAVATRTKLRSAKCVRWASRTSRGPIRNASPWTGSPAQAERREAQTRLHARVTGTKSCYEPKRRFHLQLETEIAWNSRTNRWPVASRPGRYGGVTRDSLTFTNNRRSASLLHSAASPVGTRPQRVSAGR